MNISRILIFHSKRSEGNTQAKRPWWALTTQWAQPRAPQVSGQLRTRAPPGRLLRRGGPFLHFPLWLSQWWLPHVALGAWP